MSTIGKNIKKIRAVKKISQAAFAEMFNLSRGTVGSYEEERAEPKIETIIQIAQKFGLSIDILLTKELTVNELFKFDLFKHEKSAKPAEADVDKDSREDATPLVRSSQYIEYVVNHQNKDFINRLPFVRLPDTTQKKSRAFEVQDDSMQWLDTGLHVGDVLSCCPLEADFKDKLKEGQVYVLVVQEGIYVRRYKHTKEQLYFVADNSQHPPVVVDSTEVSELWKVEGFYSTYLNPPLLIEERVSKLEQKMAEIEKRLTER